MAEYEERRFSKFASTANGIKYPTLRLTSVAGMMQEMHTALATIEMRRAATQGEVGGAFAAGQTYDYFQRLTDYLDRAQATLLLVDPYLDEVVVNDYLNGMRKKVSVHLLTSGKRPDYTARLIPALRYGAAQYGIRVELRQSGELHDRLVFLDNLGECIVMGSSVRTAGQKSPTYLAPLDHEIATLKRQIYEDIWSRATVVVVP